MYTKAQWDREEKVCVCDAEGEKSTRNHIVMASRTQTRIIHYLLKTPVREGRVQVSAQHVKGESEGTKSGKGPDPET